MESGGKETASGPEVLPCPRCRTTNKATAKFCRQCGAALNIDANSSGPIARASVASDQAQTDLSSSGARALAGVHSEQEAEIGDVPVEQQQAAEIVGRASGASGMVGDLIEQHWPAIEKVLREQVAPRALAAATNDELIETIARTLHALLPLPIRIVIRPQRLANWCLLNRDRILRIVRPGGIDHPADASKARAEPAPTAGEPPIEIDGYGRIHPPQPPSGEPGAAGDGVPDGADDLRLAAKGPRWGMALWIGAGVIVVVAGLAFFLTSRGQSTADEQKATTRATPLVAGRGNLRVEVNVPARATLDGWHLPDAGSQPASVLVFSNVEATTHTLEVWSEGYRRESSSVAIKAGQTIRVAVNLQAAVPTVGGTAGEAGSPGRSTQALLETRSNRALSVYR